MSVSRKIDSFCVFCLVTLISLSCCSEKLKYSDVTVSTSNKNFVRIVSNVTATGSDQLHSTSLTAALSNALSDVTTLVQNLTVKIIHRDAENIINQLMTRVTDALGKISNSLAVAGETIAQDLVTRVLNQIGRVKDELFGLAQNLDEQFDVVVRQLNDSLINHSESIDAWTFNMKNNLRTINDTRIYKKGCQAVDDFIREATDDLQKCCNITIKPVVSLCHKFRIVLANVLRGLAEALDRMQNCIEDKKSYSEYMIPCVNVAYEEVSSLFLEAAQLRKRVETILPVKILYSSCCISVALIKIEQRQNYLANEFLSNDI